ncbi:hypothetical protein [Jannaschia formosa]|uniref:hypothetical protein n=1 Tax=Jannaschia formosa TaxID=2259592 RepID=UPI000E1BBEFE|nr:hypothetical protein [Jannaschia formosa]TFL16409.1 hypothetical protein DR046_20005 [Jannaschia formosa]
MSPIAESIQMLVDAMEQRDRQIEDLQARHEAMSLFVCMAFAQNIAHMPRDDREAQMEDMQGFLRASLRSSAAGDAAAQSSFFDEIEKLAEQVLDQANQIERMRSQSD